MPYHISANVIVDKASSEGEHSLMRLMTIVSPRIQ